MGRKRAENSEQTIYYTFLNFHFINSAICEHTASIKFGFVWIFFFLQIQNKFKKKPWTYPPCGFLLHFCFLFIVQNHSMLSLFTAHYTYK